MTVMWEILKMIGVILAVFALSWFCVRWSKKHQPKKNWGEWDERQRQAHGTANGISLGVGFIYSIVLIFWSEFGEFPMSVTKMLMLGLLLQVLVVHTCCYLMDEALSYSQKPLRAAAFWLFFGVLDVSTYFVGLEKEYKRFDMLIGMSALYLAALNLIKFIRDKKEAEE